MNGKTGTFSFSAWVKRGYRRFVGWRGGARCCAPQTRAKRLRPWERSAKRTPASA
jgi:hypothetical protein